MINEEGRTENLMKTLIKSADVEDKFEKIIENCKKINSKYIDPDFYPQIDITKEDKDILQEHEWKRIEDEYPSPLFENISPESVRQGRLGDCYFVVSLIYAAEDIEKVKYLFHPKSSLKYGCVLVYFWFLGERIPVIIDTLVAFKSSSTSKRPIFSHPRTKNESCWFSLVEKAFAKVCGGYNFIVSGTTHFGAHVLFDYFSVAHSKLEDLLQDSVSKINDEKKKKDEIFQILLNLKKRNVIIGSHIYMFNFPNKTASEIEHSSGLIPDHGYYVIDVREAENKKFLKLRNPWGKFEWKGEYSNKSTKWTDSLKMELKYKNCKDGSFWMLYDDFLNYFTSIGYSLAKEKEWKEMSVYGQIEGYLDGRSPFAFSRNTGCIPQWTIKFSKKAVVRLTYDVSGPSSYHGLYLCKNHGLKVDLIKEKIKFVHSIANTFVNGIEYEVDDFSEPFTFFLTRHEMKDRPCYFRILIESSDKDFQVKKFDDDFLNEKWNCVSESGIFFSSEKHQWNPFKNRPLSTCKQWFIKFTELKENEETELRIRFFKTISEGPLFVIVARKDEKINYASKQFEYYNFTAYPTSEYEEYRIPINSKYRNTDNSKLNNNCKENSCNYVISVYRNKQNDINKFKFILMCKKKFEFGLLPDPDPIKNCVYKIESKIQPEFNINNNSPYWSNVSNFKQWCLIFQKSPTTLFIDFHSKNISSTHTVLMEMKDFPGDKIDIFHRRSASFIFDIRQDCEYNRKIWKIEDISKPYALCVCREFADNLSEFVLNIFGSENFLMFEMTKNGIGRNVPQLCSDEIEHENKEEVKFDDVVFVEQPINFQPKKTFHSQFSESKEKLNTLVTLPHSKLNQNQKLTNNSKEDDNKITNLERPNPEPESANGLCSKCCLLI